MNIFLKQVIYLSRKNSNEHLMIDLISELEWIGSGLRISALRQVLPPDARHRSQRQN